MKSFLVMLVLCLSNLVYSQGLLVEENHTVLFGADTIGAGVKTMWLPHKAAFRTGGVGAIRVNGQAFNAGITWDADDIGSFSFASGHGSRASGIYTIAMGLSAEATGFHSMAIGAGVTSSNLYSLALGNGSNASGRFSLAMGHDSEAEGSESTALGSRTKAVGETSLATGFETEALGMRSLSFGDSTIAMGPNSVTMGNRTTAISHSEVVLGQYNTLYNSVGYNGDLWASDDRLFVVGNGISKSDRSDAIVVLKNGKTGIGSSDPNVVLEVIGDGDDQGGVAGFNEVSAFFKNKLADTHSAMSIDASAGRDAIIYLSEDSVAVWDVRHDKSANSDFNIRYHGDAGNDTKLSLDITGNLTIDGVLNPSSDVNRKHMISNIDESEILKKVSSLPIKTWSYKGESIPHIGPMAQDFYASFGYGKGETTIATADADGVALASIKALHEKVIFLIADVKSQNEKIEKQDRIISELLDRINKLENK